MALQLFKIADTTVESPVTTVTFSSIPSGYTDLKLVVSARTDSAAVYGIGFIRPNGATTNLSNKVLEGTGSGAGSYSETSWRFEPNGGTSTSSTFGNAEIYIPNYAGSNNKSASADTVQETNATAAYSYLKAYLWSNTAAITSIDIVTNSGQSWQANSTFTLYGVL
jgi:hypothetical protein